MKPLALVVENDAGTRRLLDVLLSRAGMEVDLAPTGTDALIALQHVQYDFVVLELLLPGRAGMELLTWLEEERPHMLARALVVSSASPAQLALVTERWPAARVIRKPFELGEILETAAALAAERQERTRSAAENFCRYSMRAGAKAGVVVAATNGVIAPMLSFGYTAAMVRSYFPLPVDAPYPLCAAVREEKPVWIASVSAAAHDYPTLAQVWEANQSRALATVPLRDEGRVIGAAGWTFREARLFSAAEQKLFTDIASAIPQWLAQDGNAAATFDS
jgi:CheY-like chemotaxis protein